MAHLQHSLQNLVLALENLEARLMDRLERPPEGEAWLSVRRQAQSARESAREASREIADILDDTKTLLSDLEASTASEGS